MATSAAQDQGAPITNTPQLHKMKCRSALGNPPGHRPWGCGHAPAPLYAAAAARPGSAGEPPMTPRTDDPRYATCPYRGLPPASRWADAVAAIPPDRVNPHTPAPFRIGPDTRVATGGRCFAHHISPSPGGEGVTYYAVEPAPPRPPAAPRARDNFQGFSARSC